MFKEQKWTLVHKKSKEKQKVLALETELQQEEVLSESSANGAENKKGFWRRIFG